MFLKSLILRQFRNYAQAEVPLSAKLNLFVGPNGSGKSNVLEGICVLGTGQSHRGADTKVMLQWEKNEAVLKGVFEGEEPRGVDIRLKAGRPRHVLVNNRIQRRLKDWVGQVPVVSFSPDDLDLVKGEPSLRRRSFNSILCQAEPKYNEVFQRYSQVVEERNAALKQVQEGKRQKSVLEPWDNALLKEGAFLTLDRQRFVHEFSIHVHNQHETLSSGKEKAAVFYKSSFVIPEGGVEKLIELNQYKLRSLREGEIALGSTLTGPHRDDIVFYLNGRPAKAYASQGQQRTLALAYKLAERAFLRDRTDRKPICLFDDVLSELDIGRRVQLTHVLLGGYQCFVTMTDLSEWPEFFQSAPGADHQVFQVDEGKIRKDTVSPSGEYKLL